MKIKNHENRMKLIQAVKSMEEVALGQTFITEEWMALICVGSMVEHSPERVEGVLEKLGLKRSDLASDIIEQIENANEEVVAN